MSPAYLHSKKMLMKFRLKKKKMTPDENSDQHKEMKNAELVNV